MFDYDSWQEIFDSISKNKLRTFLTGLSVASGVFILVILLGFGQGMQNGIRKEFEVDATNKIWVWTQATTKEYKGLNPGRRFNLKNKDFEYIEENYSDVLEYRSGVFYVRGDVIYNNESGSYSIQGVSQDYQKIENVRMVRGRFLNQNDMDTKNKVVVISLKVRREFMKDVEDPLNEYLKLSGINFKIIGVYADEGGEREENKLYIPITAAQTIFNGKNKLNNITFTLLPEKTFDETVEVSNKFTKQIETYLKEAHTVAPDDNSAVNVYNALDNAKRFYILIDNIALFFWIVGIFTIIAGVVGVSNIMLIIVKERTKEIGIRKALGAKPSTVIWMVLKESIFVTTISGFTGLILSMALLEFVGSSVQIEYILNPSVNFRIALTMVFILIIAGGLAGFFPAWRAATIKPIEALRDE
jgi:putative ABC transport system permease protein